MVGLPLFTGLGGGTGGCLAEVGVIAPAAAGCWGFALAEETVRAGLAAAAAAAAEGEGYWAVGWLDGVRGGPSVAGSEVEVINHFGGMTDCLGGRGSRKVSRNASRSGTKWLSDSIKKTAQWVNGLTPQI